MCEREGERRRGEVTKLEILSLLTPLFQTIQHMTVFGGTQRADSEQYQSSFGFNRCLDV